jgi:hypothetical protein
VRKKYSLVEPSSSYFADPRADAPCRVAERIGRSYGENTLKWGKAPGKKKALDLGLKGNGFISS